VSFAFLELRLHWVWVFLLQLLYLRVAILI